MPILCQLSLHPTSSALDQASRTATVVWELMQDTDNGELGGRFDRRLWADYRPYLRRGNLEAYSLVLLSFPCT